MQETWREPAVPLLAQRKEKSCQSREARKEYGTYASKFVIVAVNTSSLAVIA